MQTQASQRDRTLCLITAALFAASYVGAAAALKSLEMSSGARIALALSPFPFFVAFLVAEIRVLRQVDELERRIQLEALAIAFPAAVLLLMALALLERAVPLSPQDWSYRHVWAFLPLLYFAGLGVARRRYR
jgi:hypothetical protein